MLGEIIKNTEALRYHAKSAEIAGKNLAHVNDENYARQRVLAREGLMYNGQGGLNTSAIEAGGLDHSRNELIDKRLFNEFGQTASLEAQQEILKLLQAALGEKIDRQSIDGGLDDEHDSNLSAGGLARAMDDLFNAFQELSSSPDTTVASQEVFNKLNTLTKRFNDAGIALDEIDSDLTVSISDAVDKVNRIIDQVHEVNIQIRRFELLGQGKAVAYRDQRQKLLEDLSKLIDFQTSPEINSLGRETGFLNIFVKDFTNQNLTLIDANSGVHQLSKDFGNAINPRSVGTNGIGLQIKAKVDDNGKLGFVEVIEAGAQYDDKNGPLILTFTPPLRGGLNVSTEQHGKFSFFEQDGTYYQALEDVPVGVSLTDPRYFLEKSEVVTLKSYPSGTPFKQEGQFYQALVDMPAGSKLSDELSFERIEPVNLTPRLAGSFFEESNKFFQVFSDLEVGVPLSHAGSFVQIDPISLVQRKEGEVFEQDGTYYQALVATEPGILLSDVDSFEVLAEPVSLVERNEGELFEQDGTYYQALVSTEPGILLSDVDSFEVLAEPVSLVGRNEGEVFEQDGKYYRSILVSEPGLLLNDTNSFELLEFGITKEDYSKGEFFEQDGRYYKVYSDLASGTSLSEVASFIEIKPVTTADYSKGDIFFQNGVYHEALDDIQAGTSLLNSSIKCPLDEPVSLVDHSRGSIFKQDGAYYEALDDVPKWTPLSDSGSFLLKSEPLSLTALSEGSFFSQNGMYYQALVDVPKGTPLSNTASFLEIDPRLIPSNGDLTSYPETLRRYSDLETFKAGEQIYYNGKLLQVTRDLDPITKNDGIELDIRDYQNGEVVKIDGVFYQFQEDILAENVDFDALKSTSLLSLGLNLPQEVEELSYFQNVIGEDRFFSSKSYANGEWVKIYDQNLEEFRYLKIDQEIIRQDEFKILANEDGNWILTNPEGTTILAEEKLDVEGNKIDPNYGMTKTVLLDGSSEPIIIDGVYEKEGTEVNVITAHAQSIDEFKTKEVPMRFRQNEVYYSLKDGVSTHFVVVDPPEDISPIDFDPFDDQWSSHFKVFTPQLVNESDPSLFFKRAHPSGYDSFIEDGSLVELNLGIAEAVLNDGQITGFHILNSGNSLPKSDSVFVHGKEVNFSRGSIKGYQIAKSEYVSKFRGDLNKLVSEFVENANGIYNDSDIPGGYLFGFDAILTRPVVGRNSLMEEEYGLFGREGEGNIKLYREEVAMQLPNADSETFNVVNVSPVFPEEFRGQQYYVRGDDAATIDFNPENEGPSYSFYASARRMQNITMENDPNYSGEDKILGTADDGRSYMMAYEPIPFRLDGLEDGSKLPIIGDNFSFQALPSNPWNLATSLKVQKHISVDSISEGKIAKESSDNFALKIAEMAGGEYLNDIAILNSDIGNSLSNIGDNLEHQQSIENVLMDQRRAVSSVSIDEEVADLMRFQRSFQASSRVLNTLDKMLEIVVMGLVK
jgi:flagellar hook-associated protein FlgK